MQKHSSLIRRAGMVLAVAALVAAHAVVAQVPGADGAIHACVHKKRGTIRIVAAGASCKRHEQTLSWSQQGPAGTNGAPGTARAYGLVSQGGVLSRDLNLTVTHPRAGVYCLRLA